MKTLLNIFSVFGVKLFTANEVTEIRKPDLALIEELQTEVRRLNFALGFAKAKGKKS